MKNVLIFLKSHEGHVTLMVAGVVITCIVLATLDKLGVAL